MSNHRTNISRFFAIVSSLLMIGTVDIALAARDKVVPSVSISSPANASTVNAGTVPITGSASDNIKVNKVEVSIGGTSSYQLATPRASGDWSTWTFNASLSQAGNTTIYARATDSANNRSTTSVTVTVTFPPDNVAPQISISLPTEGSTVSGAAFSMQGTASDNAGGRGIDKVEVSVDGAPYTMAKANSVDWSSWSYSAPLGTDGPHQASAIATDKAGNVSSVATVSFNSSAIGFDQFGVKKLYASKPGGEEWYFSTPTNDPRFLPQTTMTLNPDGSYKVTAKQVRLGVLTTSGYHPELITTYNQTELAAKGYMQSANDWRDVEITAYVKLNASANDNFAWYARGGKHNDLNNGCEGSSYKGDLHFNGQSRFAKEQWHSGGYSFTPYVPAVSSVLGRWVGFKTIMYNVQLNGITAVKMENWVDDANNGNWVKVDEYLDQGGWGAEGTHCGGTPDQIISWGGPIATFRWDTTNNVDIKFMSVREIQP